MQSVWAAEELSPSLRRKELHATEGAVEVRRARRRLGEAATDERVGLFTPDKKRGTADVAGRAANLAARRGTVCGEAGRVPRFPPIHGPSPVPRSPIAPVLMCFLRQPDAC